MFADKMDAPRGEGWRERHRPLTYETLETMMR
jgi:hypothetical protein